MLGLAFFPLERFVSGSISNIIGIVVADSFYLNRVYLSCCRSFDFCFIKIGQAVFEIQPTGWVSASLTRNQVITSTVFR